MTCKRKKWKPIKKLTWYEAKCICIINKKPITLNLLKQAKKLKKNQNPDGVLSVRGLVKDKTWQKKREKNKGKRIFERLQLWSKAKTIDTQIKKHRDSKEFRYWHAKVFNSCGWPLQNMSQK